MNKKILIPMVSLTVMAVIGFLIYSFSPSYSFRPSYDFLENGSRVGADSEVTYYIDVLYDGKDTEGVLSSDNNTAKVYSDVISVSDVLPEGMTFVKFVESGNETIGAVKRSDGSSCSGNVIDGYDGLHYNSSDNTVSFQVRDLQAGCKLTVGVVAKTPLLGTAKRKDFYNTAVGEENNNSKYSNTVHVFIGRENEPRYNITYAYVGEVPAGAPALPANEEYAEGTIVSVPKNINIKGYTFVPWSSDDVTITNNKFTMPNEDITVYGSFVRNTTHKVTYTIDGDSPSNYIVPDEKLYGVGDTVKVDSLEVGSIINGYKFLGWTSNETIEDNRIIMPDNDVTITGRFEQIKYTVSYVFQGTDIPSNGSSIVPVTKSYAPGETVTIANNPTASGYKFLGWYSPLSFEMPEEDVVIYGEWMKVNGLITPTITKEITNRKDVFYKGDVVEFTIKVTNNNNYEIKDVMLEDYLEGITYVENDNYKIKTSTIVLIPKISANESVDVYATYNVVDTSKSNITNTVELIGAVADNNTLDTSRKYIATANFNVEEVPNNPPVEEPKPTTPLTIDTILTYVLIFGGSIVVIVLLALYIKKLINKERNK